MISGGGPSAAQFGRLARHFAGRSLPRRVCRRRPATPAPHPGVGTEGCGMRGGGYSVRLGWTSANAAPLNLVGDDPPPSVAEMLEALGDAPLPLEGSTGASASLRRLAERQYVELQSLPWLQPNTELARLQLVISQQLDERMAPILTHRGFHRLLAALDGQLDELTSTMLTSTLQHLTSLGVAVTHPTLHRCLAACVRRLDALPLPALVNFGDVFRTFPKGMRLAHLHAFLQRYTRVLDADDIDIAGVMDIFKNAGYYMSRRLYWRTLKAIEEGAERGVLTEPRVIAQLAYVGRRCYYSGASQQTIACRMLTLARDAALEHLEAFQPRHIAEMCSSLKLTQLYKPPVTRRFVEHSVRLLVRGGAAMRLCDVSNLLYALCSNTPIALRRQFEDAVYRRMHDADVVILSNLGETFHQMALVNDDVLRRFESLVLQHADRLTQYSTRLQLVLRFLAKHRFMKSADDDAFCARLIAMVNDRPLETALMPSLAAFLLGSPHADYLADDVLFERMVAAVPRWPVSSLHRVVLALRDRPGASAEGRARLARVQHAIYAAVAAQLPSISSLRGLLQLTNSLGLHRGADDVPLTDTLLHLFPQFITPASDPADIVRVTQLFRRLRIPLARVYDQLAAYAVDNACLSLTSFTWVLRATAQTTHAPANMRVFVRTLTEKLDAEGDVLQELRVLDQLSILGCFLDDRLQRVFSLPFIRKVDKFIAQNHKLRLETEDVMMRLNRSVLLECPQLDVPWFHEHYCRSVTQTVMEDVDKEALKEEVEECLLEVLGDTKLLERDALTAYHYTIDFECVLDKKGTAIPVKSAHSDAAQQRVAILVFTHNDFCYNSKQLIGSEQRMVRQLQIMGYKVIQIAYVDWYSMGLTDWQTKVEYVKGKLFASS